MSTENSAPQLPDKPKGSKRGLIITIAVLAVAVIVAAIFLLPGLFGGNDNDDTAGDTPGDAEETTSEPVTVRLGTTDASQGHWTVLADILAEENITLEVVPFSSYETPNPALADGEIDLNAFQHIDYLSDHNNATGDDLRVVGATLIVPLPIYSSTYDDVADIPDGARIAIPNDATNQARALRVLEAADLVELADVSAPTPNDIESARIEVEPVDASQTAPALNDPQIAAAIVNNNYATDAGILDQAIFEVDPSEIGVGDQPYVNIIASRPGEETDPAYVAVWEAYHDPRVTEIVVEESGGTSTIVEADPADVQQWLADLEAAKAEQG